MKRLNECGCGCGGAKGGCQKPEGSMAKHDAMECAEDAQAVADMIQDTDNLPEWLESKITLAADYMNRVKDYLSHYKQHGDMMPGFGGNITQPQFVPVDMPSDGNMKQFIKEIIRKVKGGYRLYSHKGRNLGTFDSKSAAKKHEREVQYFKHKK
jgi:hypothetical protein